MPWVNPASGRITSGYGPRWGSFHTGTDIAGTGNAGAANDGVVVRVRTGSYPGDRRSGALPGRTGNGVLIDHGGGIQTYYGHLASVYVRPGQTVRAGQAVGRIGTTGNALDVNTPVLTRNRGWVRHGDLVEGDVVYDETGEPTNITSVAHWFNRPTYRIRFDDGTTIDADENHLWAVLDNRDKAAGLKVVSTKEIAETYSYGRTKKYSRYAIPVTGYLKREPKEYTIDPYALGYWLGDGHEANARVSVGKGDLEEVSALLTDVGESFNVSPDSCGNWHLTLIGQKVPEGEYRDKTGWNQHPEAFSVRLKNLGLIRDKHIPREYLEGSYEQRLALLQGLLDSDGYIDPRQGTVEFVQAGENHKRLAYQVLELALSLGIKATLKEGDATLRGKRTSTKYRVCFTTDLQVFRLSRKASVAAQLTGQRSERSRRRIAHRFIQSVDRVEARDTNCITVDSASHLYLAGEHLVPTHNSTGVHLHFEVLINGSTVNPQPWMAARGAALGYGRTMASGGAPNVPDPRPPALQMKDTPIAFTITFTTPIIR